MHYTTIDGLIEKNKTGKEDFYVKERLIELYNKKDFGQFFLHDDLMDSKLTQSPLCINAVVDLIEAAAPA